MAPCIRPPVVARELARTQQIGGSQAGSGQLPLSATASRSGAIDGANRNDVRMLEPTLNAVEAMGLLTDIGTLHLDRGYDYPVVRARLAGYGLDDLNIQQRGIKQS